MAHTNGDNGTALATRQAENLERFGDRSQIREMFERIKQMIPGAANAPDAVVLAAAQKAVAHGLDVLDDEIYLMEVKGRWTAHVGIRGLRRNAEGKHMFEESDDYPRRLSDDEIKADIGKDAKTGTIGVEVRMYNLVKARECKELGIPYFPRKERGYWFPGDNIPATRTGAWVAQKRGEKMALRAEFALTWSGEASEAETMKHLEFKLRQEDRRTALPASQPRGTMDDDIDALWAQAQAANGPQDAQDAPDGAEDGEYRETDAETVADDSRALSDAHERLHTVGRETFGPDWSQASLWLIRRYTEANTPDNPHDEILDLTADQCDDLADKTVANRKRYQAGWKAHQAKEAQEV